MKLSIKLEWNETEAVYADLKFSDKELQDHELVMESIKLAWASMRGNYMAKVHGPKWQEKKFAGEIKRKWANA